MRIVRALLLAAVLAGCAGDDEWVTVYLEQRLGPEGPLGQIAPVLEPTERAPREGMGAAAQVLVQLRQGPTPDERARGMRAPVAPTTTHTRASFRGWQGEPCASRGANRCLSDR
jgi:hypothetical protein